MTPSPPCCAIAMASLDSVTVSIAALTQRHVQADVPREPGADVHLVGKHRRMLRHEQHVVEGERGGKADVGGRQGREERQFSSS